MPRADCSSNTIRDSISRVAPSLRGPRFAPALRHARRPCALTRSLLSPPPSFAGAGFTRADDAAGSTAAAPEGAPQSPSTPHAPPLLQPCVRTRCRSRARSSAPCATWQVSPRGQPAAPRASSSAVGALRRTPTDAAGRCGPPCGSRTRRDPSIASTAGEGSQVNTVASCAPQSVASLPKVTHTRLFWRVRPESERSRVRCASRPPAQP